MSLASSEPGAASTQMKAPEDWLIAYQRQAMLGSVAAMVAHEFNNLMSPVLTRAQFALTDQAPDMMQKAVTVTVRNTERAVGIARRLLEVAQGDEAQKQRYSVAEALKNIELLLARPMDKFGIDYSEEVAEDLTVIADPILFEQVLLNLLLNARAATEKTKGSIRVQAAAVDGAAQIAITDSGIGIPDEKMREVFVPFLAAAPSHDPQAWVHVGLGLHACRWIAHQHEARITVASNDGGGCTFTLAWPLA